jgi:hypothetical protein
MDRYRFILGIVLVVGLLALAAIFALGHVEEKSSYGLTNVLILISPVANALATWAFPPRKKEEPEDEKPADTSGKTSLERR